MAIGTGHTHVSLAQRPFASDPTPSYWIHTYDYTNQQCLKTICDLHAFSPIPKSPATRSMFRGTYSVH